MKSILKFLLEPSFIIGVSLIVLIKSTIIDFHDIPSGSMEPGVNVGDLVFDYRLEYGIRIPFSNEYIYRWGEPRYGDVVFAYSPESRWHETVIKRVLAVGGDEIQFIDKDVFINGVKIDCKDSSDTEYFFFCNEQHGNSEYLVKKSKMKKIFGDYTERFVVPDGHVFLVGDNRNNSKDSRSWGALSIDRVYGKKVYTLPSSKSYLNVILLLLGCLVARDVYVKSRTEKSKA